MSKHYFVKSIHFIPQTATVTPLRAPTPEVSPFVKFDFKPVSNETISIVFRNSLTGFTFFKENVESSAYARYVF